MSSGNSAFGCPPSLATLPVMTFANSKCSKSFLLLRLFCTVSTKLKWLRNFFFLNSTLPYSWIEHKLVIHFPAGIYLLKVSNRHTRKRCEICSKLTIKTSERCQWRRSGVFIVDLERISHLGTVFLLSTLNM